VVHRQAGRSKEPDGRANAIGALPLVPAKPASVLVVPVDVTIIRMVWLSVSAPRKHCRRDPPKSPRGC